VLVAGLFLDSDEEEALFLACLVRTVQDFSASRSRVCREYSKIGRNKKREIGHRAGAMNIDSDCLLVLQALLFLCVARYNSGEKRSLPLLVERLGTPGPPLRGRGQIGPSGLLMGFSP
jgi:hypothetical protein